MTCKTGYFETMYDIRDYLSICLYLWRFKSKHVKLTYHHLQWKKDSWFNLLYIKSTYRIHFIWLSCTIHFCQPFELYFSQHYKGHFITRIRNQAALVFVYELTKLLLLLPYVFGRVLLRKSKVSNACPEKE